MEGLDDIVNAISDILLAFEEAQADFKTNLVIEAKNLDFLLTEINNMTAENRKQNESIKDENVKARWEQTNVDISNAASRLAKLVRGFKGGVIERWAYGNLHDELKIILQNLIYQIQITDYVNVSVMMELIKRNLDVVVRMKNCVVGNIRSQAGALNGLVLISREASKVALDLQINLRTRMAEMTDKDLRSRLNNASEVIRDGMPQAISACQRAIESPNGPNNAAREKALYDVLEALEDISVVVQLTSQAVANFALMFPLPPLTAKEEPQQRKETSSTSYAVPQRAPRVNQELNRLEDAVRRGDDKTAVAAAKGFADESQKQVAMTRAAAKQQKDPGLSDDMLRNADDLQRVTPQVVAATKEALSRKNDPVAQSNLYDKINEARAINAKIEDGRKPEKQLLDLNRDLDRNLRSLADYAKAGDVPKSAEYAKRVADQLRQQAAIGRAFAENVKDPQRKKEILDACDDIDRVVAEIAKAVKAVLENPNDMDAQRRLDDVINKAKGAGNKLTRAMLEELLNQNKESLFPLLAKLWEAANNGDAQAATDLLKAISDDIARRIELGEKLAQEVKDPVLREQILKACDDLRKLTPELVLATKAVLADPTNQAAKKRLKDIIEDIKDAANRVTATKRFDDRARSTPKLHRGIDQVADELINVSNSLGDAIANLRNASRRGDADAARRHADEIAEYIPQETALARELAGLTSDPALRDQLNRDADKLDSLRQQILDATRDAMANRNDPSKQRHLENLLDEADRLNKALHNAAQKAKNPPPKNIDTTAEDLLAVSNNLGNAIKNLRNAADRGDAGAAHHHAREIGEFIPQETALARQLADQINDRTLQKQLREAAATLDVLNKPIADATREAMADPKNKAKQDHLKKLLNQAEAANNAIANAAERARNPNKKIDDIASSMKKRLSLVSNQMDWRGNKNEHGLTNAANLLKAAIPRNPPQMAEQKELNELAAAIAAEMAALSSAAQQGRKKDMIGSARKIADMITKVQQLSGVISNKCTDPVLKQQLASICKVPKNFAVQLKIIAGVKAASSDDDPAAEAQLITCAQGVANSVAQTVKAAEAASVNATRN